MILIVLIEYSMQGFEFMSYAVQLRCTWRHDGEIVTIVSTGQLYSSLQHMSSVCFTQAVQSKLLECFTSVLIIFEN